METFYYNSPVGALKITAQDSTVTGIHFLTKKTSPPQPKSDFAKKVTQELSEYFTNKRSKFTFAFKPEGTDFQKEVWDALKNVKFSKTVSYKDIAAKINRPKAIRAVGTACGRNPLPIVIPCHRIVTTGGDLGGFSGGLWRKKWLLKHEKPAV